MFNSAKKLAKNTTKKTKIELENNFLGNELTNFYGETFKPKIPIKKSVSQIKNQASKEIAYLKQRLKTELRYDEKILSKVKLSRNKYYSANKKTIKYEAQFKVIKAKEENIEYKKNSNFGIYLKHQKNLLKKEISNIAKSFKLQINGIGRSGDSIEYKTKTIQKIHSISYDEQKNIIEKINIIDDFLNKKVKLNTFIKNSWANEKYQTFKKIESQFNKNKDLLKELKNNAKKYKTENIKKISSKRTNNINHDKKILFEKELTIYEKIELIKETRDKAITEFKNRKILIEAKNTKKEITFVKTLWIYISFFILSNFYDSILFVKWLTKIYIKGIYPKKYKLYEKHYRNLAATFPVGSYNEEFYLNASSISKKAFENVLEAESKKFINYKNKDQIRKIKFQSKKNIKKTKISKKNILRKEIKSSFQRFFKRNISYLAFKNIFKYSIKGYLDNIKKIKLKSPYYKLKHDRKSARRQYSISINKTKQTLNNEMEILIKKTPMEAKKGIRYLWMMLNLIFGGLGYICARQFKKGLIFLIITSLLYAFAIPFILGFTPVGGNGIFGLISMGDGQYLADSRFYLVEGIYSFTLLVILFIYLIIMSISGYKTGLLAERGVRLGNWFITKRVLDKVHLPYLLSIPAFIIVLFNVIAPLIALFIIGFTNWGSSADPIAGDILKYVGFKNFGLLFEGSGIGKIIAEGFVKILAWTLIWGIATFSLALIINIGTAILLNSDRIRYKALWRTIMILPMAIPAFIMILMFRILLAGPSSIGTGDGGPLFSLLVKMHLWIEIQNNATTGISGINNILLNVWAVRIILIMMSIWFGIGGGMLYYTGIIQSISPSLYEAAEVDGANKFRQHTSITIPHLLFIITPTLIPDFIAAINNYGLIWIFNDGGPADQTSVIGAGQTDIILSWIYKIIKSGSATFENSMGLTAVICIIFGLLSVGIAAPGVFKSKMFKEGDY